MIKTVSVFTHNICLGHQALRQLLAELQRRVEDVSKVLGDGRVAEGRREKRGEKCIYLPPFDHPLVWEGNASIIDEIHSQMPSDEPNSKPDVIVCSVGGGGLFMAGAMWPRWRESRPAIASIYVKSADDEFN